MPHSLTMSLHMKLLFSLLCFSTTFDAMSGLYTCITCRVGFGTSELQRGHYKTDWHRYNLKRKVAELPPVTADTFQQKVLAQREKVITDVQM